MAIRTMVFAPLLALLSVHVLAKPVPSAAVTTAPGPVSVTATGNPVSMTITISNAMSTAISTAFNGPSSGVSGKINSGTIAPSSTAVFAVPSGWSGNVAYGRGDLPLNLQSGSLFEASFVQPVDPKTNTTTGPAVPDIDVSYVTGYSLPGVCKCEGKVTTGCSTDLDVTTCPEADQVLGGVCANEWRNNVATTVALPFFAPCQNAAYTFPNDNKANTYGNQCSTVSCCVGPTCSDNPAQLIKKGGSK